MLKTPTQLKPRKFNSKEQQNGIHKIHIILLICDLNSHLQTCQIQQISSHLGVTICWTGLLDSNSKEENNKTIILLYQIAMKTDPVFYN